jgi:hypothetical protein
MKVVINKCYGGFSLSDAAYEKLIEWGIPVRRYQEQPRNPVTGLYQKVEANEGEVIFDRELIPAGEDEHTDRFYRAYKGTPGLFARYWETWTSSARSHPLVVRVVEELGAGHRTGASGQCANLKIVEIPDGTEYEIDEYDGMEHIAEVHQTWG